MEIKVSKDKGVKTFAVRSEEVYQEYASICKRNGRKIADDLDSYMRDVIKNHSTGNDQFKITQWVNEDIKAVPAFFSGHEIWLKYHRKIDDKSFEDLSKQLEIILNVNGANHRERYKHDVQPI